MSVRATARVVRSIVAPAIGVSAAALAAGTAILVVACNKEPGSGPYTGPVGMAPAYVNDAQAPTPVPPGLVAQPPPGIVAQPPGIVAPGMPPAPVTGTPTQSAPPVTPPGGSGMLPGAAATALAGSRAAVRPSRVQRRATDHTEGLRFAGLAGRFGGSTC